ncbi:acetyltransferase [uncultured Fusobacterium sp.]|jgi:acetyltransferase EpsM|uniref:acetyltransferase n=1 Tax=uncultured Fusobacterium sp. TaxID=159267 RepID=UPI00258E95D7|nr:acetyltransferase [uncultured Fusobacterium sp.]
MKDIVIIGAGGHAKVVADIILKRKEVLKEELNIIGFLDDNFDKIEYREIFNIPILGSLDLIEEFKNKDYEYIIAIGNNLIRKKLAKKYSKLIYYTAIHPTVVIGNMVTIEEGTVVMANVVINSYSKIGKHCILNTSCVIEHDNIIADYIHISPSATLCGKVRVDTCAWIGAGSRIKQGISIGENTVIGLGSVVLKNINKDCVVIGNPANILRRKE